MRWRDIQQFLRTFVQSHLKFRKIIDNPASFFVLVALVVGVVFVVTNPPGFGLDERAHFMRTYLISSGHFFPTKLPPENSPGAYLPVNLVQFVGISTSDLLDNDMGKFFIDRHDTNMGEYETLFKEKFSQEKVSDPSTNAQLLAAQAYSPFGYLHMAVVMKIARTLGMPLLYSMYLSRLANLILYIVLVFLAIKIIPRYKWLLVCIALLPTAIYQASCVSLDPFVTGLSFIAIAYAIRFWFADKHTITTKQAIIVTAVFVGIALIKTPYACLLLLFLGIPSNKFLSKRVAYLWKLLWVAAAFLAALWWVYVNRAITPALVGLQPGHASMSEQVQYIINNPIRVGEALIRTHYESIDHTLDSLLARAGDRQVGLPNAFIYTLFLLSTGLTAVLYAGKEKKESLTKQQSNWFNILLICTAIATVVLISVTLYVTFTPVGATTIQGIQGRYFLPILPVIMIFIFRLMRSREGADQGHVLTIIRVASLSLLVLTCLIFYLVNF